MTGTRARKSASALIIMAIAAVGCRAPESPQRTSSAAASAEASAANRVEAELPADLERLADRLVREEQFSGVVLLKRHGRVIFRQAYGLADRDAK
jgi:hypothetical protein